jgi:hypothetical protein
VNNAPVIGIAGTAKNTGKTTTLNLLLAESARRSLVVCVTGIGYDGEEIDNITLLPKPRIHLLPGTIAATSERCLQENDRQIEIIERTGLRTPLGEILIIRVKKDCTLVIAGPNKRNDLAALIELLRKYPSSAIVVDGSLNRISPMSVVDRVIITSGGSRSADSMVIAEELQAIESIFSYPVIASVISSDHPVRSIPYLLDAQDSAELLLHTFGRGEAVSVAGLVSLSALEHLAEKLQQRRYPFHTLLFHDPFVLMMNDSLVRVSSSLQTIAAAGYTVAYHHAPVLKCFTANPFIPQFEGMTYSPRFLDVPGLLGAIRSRCSVPVYNTADAPPQEIFDRCF